MKIKKLTQGLVVVPLIGAATILGTQPAAAADCSGLVSCAAASTTTAPPLPNATITSDLTVTVAPVPSAPAVVAPVKPIADAAKASVDNVTAPITSPVTTPVRDAAGNVTEPIAGSPELPEVPVAPAPVAQNPAPAGPQAPIVTAPGPANAAGTGAGNAPQIKPESGTAAAVAAQMHNSSAADAGGLGESAGTDAESVKPLDAELAALHSSKGDMTTYWDSGMFGFGHLDPADIPRNAGLAFAYFIVVGSTIGFAIKKNAFLVARKIS